MTYSITSHGVLTGPCYFINILIIRTYVTIQIICVAVTITAWFYRFSSPLLIPSNYSYSYTYLLSIAMSDISFLHMLIGFVSQWFLLLSCFLSVLKL